MRSVGLEPTRAYAHYPLNVEMGYLVFHFTLGAWGDELFKVFIEACQIRRRRITLTVA
jgi:hypothetical protein